MPLLGQSMLRSFAGNRQSMQLTTQSHREVADVDDLLNFAQRFLSDLTCFPGNDAGQFRLELAEPVADTSDKLTALRTRGHSPCMKRFGGRSQDRRNITRRSRGECCQLGPI